MPTTFTLIDLAGSIALLLLGTQMVQTGMQRAFGAGLQLLLARLLRDRGHNSEAKIIPSVISLDAGLPALRCEEAVPVLGIIRGSSEIA
jgi:phosphate:Na+ symporter